MTGSGAGEAVRIAARQLFEEGCQQGVKQGFEQVRQLAAGSLLRLLRQRFGKEVDIRAEQRVAAASLHQVEEWQQHALSAVTLAEFFRSTSPEAKELVMTAGQKLIEEGRQLGIQEGLQEGRRRFLPVVRCWLQQRFGNEAVAHAEPRIADASNEQLERWVDRLLSVATLEQLLAD
jgi:flagellar biosynthesis/type III secretory pathway protein FliH